MEIRRVIEAAIAQIKEQIKTTSSTYDKEKLQERLAKLSGGVAIVYVGASSEIELNIRKDIVDDALSATRAAMEEGIVPGGGVAYLRSLKDLDNRKFENEEEKVGKLTFYGKPLEATFEADPNQCWSGSPPKSSES